MVGHFVISIIMNYLFRKYNKKTKIDSKDLNNLKQLAGGTANLQEALAYLREKEVINKDFDISVIETTAGNPILELKKPLGIKDILTQKTKDTSYLEYKKTMLNIEQAQRVAKAINFQYIPNNNMKKQENNLEDNKTKEEHSNLNVSKELKQNEKAIEKIKEDNKKIEIPKTTVENFKLKSLYIDSFKNLKNIRIDFEQYNNLVLILGNNASGKSNIIEAISAIFSEIYLQNKNYNFNYELEYYINGKIIKVKKEDKINLSFFVDEKIRKKTKLKDLLPSKIIALYSGEETRLWEDYYKNFYRRYLKDLSKNVSDTFGKKMIYLNKNYWNIALLILLLSKKESHKSFIKNKLKIDINSVKIIFDFYIKKIKNLEQNQQNQELKGFIKEINRDLEEQKIFPLKDLSKILFPVYKSEKETHIEKYTIEQIFEILFYALMSKNNRVLKNIEINFNDNLSIISLSEGEKKYILIYTIIDILADEKSIVLLDEPDAHIHEKGKKEIYDLFKSYSDNYNRQILITTHSPTLAHCARNNNNIIMLENNNGITTIIENEKIDKIRKLTDGIWTETTQNIFLSSNTPLVLFEGNGDIEYVKTAIDFYEKEFYSLINIEFLFFGGAPNACKFINELRQISPKDKKIIAIFDRDEAGSKGMKECLQENFTQGRKNTKTFCKSNTIYLMLPKRIEHNEIDFLIEDYFSIEVKKLIAQKKIDEAEGFFNKYPTDLREKIKQELKRNEYKTAENMKGFKILLQKIQNIIEGKEKLEEVF